MPNSAKQRVPERHVVFTTVRLFVDPYYFLHTSNFPVSLLWRITTCSGIPVGPFLLIH